MDFDAEAMNHAATEAEKELDEFEDLVAVAKLADWWKKWYLTAGHKRLGRVLLQNTSDKLNL